MFLRALARFWVFLMLAASRMAAFSIAERTKGMPSVIIAKTIKGKGVSFMENNNEWHGKSLSDEDYKKALEELSKTKD